MEVELEMDELVDEVDGIGVHIVDVMVDESGRNRGLSGVLLDGNGRNRWNKWFSRWKSMR